MVVHSQLREEVDDQSQRRKTGLAYVCSCGLNCFQSNKGINDSLADGFSTYVKLIWHGLCLFLDNTLPSPDMTVILSCDN